MIGVDTGGTFTDFIYREGGGKWRVEKILSTPHNPASAVIEGISRIAGGKQPLRVIHGSTVATNAILEKKGAKTALLTNRGFEDILVIGRQNRTRLYDLFYQKSPPLVKDRYRIGIPGRMDCTGTEITPLDPSALAEAIRFLAGEGVQSVAVCFLFSFLNPLHEQGVKQALSTLGIPISLSCEILPEFREFERTSTTVINAYVAPKMSGYIREMKKRIAGGSLRIMQSNGGSISAETAANQPVRTILSGPAGGVVGARAVARFAGYDRIITFDMGGTSTDVALIDKALPITTESMIGDYPVKVPMIDIHTVGAGGGSIAGIDAGGALRVGPESAGADPGPACYGKGDRITVTDAHLFLGRLLPDHFLGGRLRLAKDRVEPLLHRMAQKAHMPAMQLAEGIVTVANTAMERALRVISVEKGYDPSEFALFSFGGAGGLHAADLARQLHIPEVIVPNNPGILSAMGMLMADIIRDYSKTIAEQDRMAGPGSLADLFGPMEKQAEADMAEEGFAPKGVRLEKYVDIRYRGQSYELMVPFDPTVMDRFHRRHEQIYGFSSPEKPVEVISLRLRAIGTPEKIEITKSQMKRTGFPEAAVIAQQEIIFDGKPATTPVLDRQRMISGQHFSGPAVIVEYSATLWVPPFCDGRVDEYGNIILAVTR